MNLFWLEKHTHTHLILVVGSLVLLLVLFLLLLLDFAWCHWIYTHSVRGSSGERANERALPSINRNISCILMCMYISAIEYCLNSSNSSSLLLSIIIWIHVAWHSTFVSECVSCARAYVCIVWMKFVCFLSLSGGWFGVCCCCCWMRLFAPTQFKLIFGKFSSSRRTGFSCVNLRRIFSAAPKFFLLIFVVSNCGHYQISKFIIRARFHLSRVRHTGILAFRHSIFSYNFCVLSALFVCLLF